MTREEWTRHGFVRVDVDEDTPQPDRFRKLVERIAAWTDEEVAVVDARQVRHIARLVSDGADPTYPPFAPSIIADAQP